MDIEGFFKSAFKNVNIDLPFKRVKSDISNYQKYSLYVNLSPSVIDNEEMYYNLLKEKIAGEITQYALKVIIGDIKSKGSVNFIDALNILDDNSTIFTMSRKIVSEIFNLNLPNVITNGRITSDYIVDSSDFNPSSISNGRLNSTFNTFEKYGDLFGSIGVYIDSYMRWTDDFILSYDDIYYDVSDIKINIKQDPSIIPVLQVEFMIYHDVINPKLTYIVENLTSNAYSKYKSELRNKRIDNILDDDKSPESNL